MSMNKLPLVDNTLTYIRFISNRFCNLAPWESFYMREFLRTDSNHSTGSEAMQPFSGQDLSILFFAGIISGALGLYLAVPVSPRISISPLINAVNIVSMTIATGLFSFLTAGILFGSRRSRLFLLKRMDEVGVRRAFFLRSLHALLITSLFTIIVTAIAFLVPIFSSYPLVDLTLFGNFVFFPSVLVASLVGSILLTLIASALASFTDDPRLCVVLGCALTLAIAYVPSWGSHDWIFTYSLLRNLSLLSLHNIVRALAVLLSGYYFQSLEDMVRYVGFTVSIDNVALSLLGMSVIAVFLLIMGQRVLSMNSNRWTILERMLPSQVIWDSAVKDEPTRYNSTKHSLALQRGFTTLIVGVLIVSVLVGGSVYNTYITNVTSTVIYTSPTEGEQIQVGTWYIFDIDVPPPYPGLINMVGIEVDVLTWGNASTYLSFYYGALEMDSTEFGLLNESIRLGSLSSWSNQTRESCGGFGNYETLDDSFGSYVCVLKIVSDSNPLETSYIEAVLTVIYQCV
jgi:hypothetical protein